MPHLTYAANGLSGYLPAEKSWQTIQRPIMMLKKSSMEPVESNAEPSAAGSLISPFQIKAAVRNSSNPTIPTKRIRSILFRIILNSFPFISVDTKDLGSKRIVLIGYAIGIVAIGAAGSGISSASATFKIDLKSHSATMRASNGHGLV